MCQSRRLFFGKRFVSISFPLIVFLLSGCSTCFVENSEGQTVVSGTVTIKSKGDGRVVIDGQRYVVKESTTIIDVNGKKISLCDLPVPCEAVVECRKGESQDPVCLKIETKRLLKGASTMVIADDPG